MNHSYNLPFFSLLQEFKALGEFAKFANQIWTWGTFRRSSHPRAILLIPGFMAGDATLYPFANWLRSRGHRVFFSGIFANADCPRRAIERLSRILCELHERYGEKLVVIGHSLGGIYARELARRHPGYIEQIVLMGAPIHEPHQMSNPFIKMLASLTIHIHESARGCSGDMSTICGVHSLTPPPGVPESIIYSKSDGVVDWRSCIESAPNVRIFEVDSTHVGLPYNLASLKIVQELIEAEPVFQDEGSSDRLH
jgi:pimeloyl-ACP methyl ester carboxylesterase